jgi:3-hydroxybutyryl-CoA dehydrogenase
MSARERIAAVGAGRMGRGIAVVFAYAGHEVHLIDAKARPAEEFARLRADALREVTETLTTLAELGMMEQPAVAPVAARVQVHGAADAQAALARADVIFEGVPETLEAKKEALAFISRSARPDAIVASTTSTILSDTLQAFVTPPERFLNAHWLNPAYLVPLIELSPGRQTDPATTGRLKRLLESIGKVPVVCTASPGYIVPRIQALAMNEAARLVEEGVASADDIDKATRYGFGFRFAVLGLLEFIDWGGGDILYYASRHLQQATGEARFAAPKIVEDNMAAGRTGLRARRGFLDYSSMDVPAYQRERLRAFVAMLRHMQMLRPPVV